MKNQFQILRILLALISCVQLNGTFSQTAVELFNEGKTLRADGKSKKAIASFEDALEEAEKEKNQSLQMSCHIELAELKDNVINYKEALAHYKAFTELYKQQMTQKHQELSESVDSLETTVNENLETINEKNKEIITKEERISVLTQDQYEAELKNRDLEIKNKQNLLELQAEKNRKNIMAAMVAMVILILIFFSLGYARKRRTNLTLRNKNYQIAKEKEKSEDLLLNILPASVAEELKEFGRTSPSSYESATIMFTDFKGFTKFSEQHSPEEIVQIIDNYFCAFDEILERYNIEKIKTIGDAYMCVSGIPNAMDNHSEVMIEAAKEIKAYVVEHSKGLKENGLPYLEMRIGIHSGPLVAGVVGSRKFAYDVWGDSVNIAARMEQSSAPGKINVSEDVYLLTRSKYQFEYRGEVEAKNKGKMKMYFLME